MPIFTLDEAVVSPLVRAVTTPELPDDLVADRFARASWSGIAEPGDRVAGELVAALGAATALTALVEHWPSTRTSDAVTDAGVELSIESIDKALERWMPRLASATALTALGEAARYDARLIVPGDELWPVGFDDLGPHAPLAVWLRGSAEALESLPSSIALVGARAATGYGEHVTMEASAGLVDRGYTIVSGAAYGIDGMAHRAALASKGLTVAFLAGGVDRFYPSGHDSLLGRIVETGAVMSELPCGSQPTKWRFLQRNRLIAASSLATIVLEAGWRSGSLNTAGHAAALGRPLGAVPGPVTSAASAGCHRLIREFDAVCVTNPDEMAELSPLGNGGLGGGSLADTERPSGAPGTLGRSTDEVRVIDALSARSPRPVPDVARRSGLSIATVQTVLGTLDLEGTVSHGERGWTFTVPR
ncbi:DNA-processing protein DprA [soil metagenome]